ncbi:MAG: NUDIX domain-containing protein [archaeon]
MSELDKYAKPSVTADLVVFAVIENDLKVLLIKRGREPFSGMWCLPGGFVRVDESVESAAMRELKEETGVSDVYLEQLYTFGNPKRDPRGRVITVAYYALVDSSKIKPHVTGDEGIESVQWFSVKELPKLGFDHDEIFHYALKRLRYKLEYTAVGLELLPELFTMTDIQNLYEIILGAKVDKRNFRKKMHLMNIVEATHHVKKGQHRPAILYKFKESKHQSKFKKVKFEKT